MNDWPEWIMKGLHRSLLNYLSLSNNRKTLLHSSQIIKITNGFEKPSDNGKEWLYLRGVKDGMGMIEEINL